MPTPKKHNAEPERSCIVTRAVKPKEELIRFVAAPDGILVADLSNKLPGRGMYVTASRLSVAEAIAKRLFSKAAGQQVQVPEGFLDQLQTALQQRVANALSLARKAGQVVTGFEKVEDALYKGKAVALIHAADAAEDGQRKLKAEKIPVFRLLSRDVLCQMLGKENATHAALTHGTASDFFIESARRFALFIE